MIRSSIQYLFLTILCFSSCSEDKIKEVEYIFSQPKVILIQPLGKFDDNILQETYLRLKPFHSGFKVLKSIPLFPDAYNKTKDRYRADSILKNLKNKHKADTLIIAFTHRDISVTKSKIKDWGVMGLAHCPGNVCVVSTYRLNSKNISEQFFKVAIHELAHTQGLPHCPDTSCYLRDAQGGRPLDYETSFCKKCSTYLAKRGWKIPS